MGRLKNSKHTIGLARQANLYTENTTDGSFAYLVGEITVPEVTQQAFDLMANGGSPGKYFAPAAGSRTGKINLKVSAFGFKRAYDPTTEECGVTAAVLHAHMLILGSLLGSAGPAAVSTDAEFLQGYGLHRCNFTGSKGATYGSGDVMGVASASELTVAGGNGTDYTVGQLFACGDGVADTAPSVSWIKGISTDTITLADACANTPVIGDDTWPTVVAALTAEEQIPFTLRLCGEDVSDKRALIGCIVDKATITFNAKEIAQIEFEISFSGITYYGTGGTFKALSVTPQMPQALIGGKGGRVTMGVGTGAMAAITLGNMIVEITNKIAPVPSIGATTGEAEKVTIEREVVVKVDYPMSTGATYTGGRTYWEQAFEEGAQHSLACYSGTAPGVGFAVFFPALHQSVAPKPIEKDGLKYEQLTLRPGQYSSDSASTGPGNSPVRFGAW